MSEGARELAELARRQLADLDRLLDGAVEVVRRETALPASPAVVTDAQMRESNRRLYETVLHRLADPDHPLDLAYARENGRQRAAVGAPLATVMTAYRVGTRYLWQEIVRRARDGGIGDAALVTAASQLWEAQDELTAAMAASYRDEQQARILVQEEERSALVQALLEGRVLEAWTMWEIADLLRIGQRGPYVVVVAELSEVSRRSLPLVEATLRGLGITSAWRLTPDTQIGVVCVGAANRLPRLLESIGRIATTRVGVSPTYDHLAETAAHLRLARIAMAGSIPGTSPVTVFDADALAVTAAAAPDVTARVAHSVLSGLDGHPERALLLGTFEAWLDAGGAVPLAAERLFCHQNTVRQRLRRLEQHTGRSLADPRQLTELCLALEIDRRLPG